MQGGVFFIKVNLYGPREAYFQSIKRLRMFLQAAIRPDEVTPQVAQFDLMLSQSAAYRLREQMLVPRKLVAIIILGWAH